MTVEQAVSGGWKGRAQQIVMLKAKVGHVRSCQVRVTARSGVHCVCCLLLRQIRKLEASLEGGLQPQQQGDVDSKAQDELAGRCPPYIHSVPSFPSLPSLPSLYESSLCGALDELPPCVS